jgi:hypothetical protein
LWSKMKNISTETKLKSKKQNKYFKTRKYDKIVNFIK